MRFLPLSPLHFSLFLLLLSSSLSLLPSLRSQYTYYYYTPGYGYRTAQSDHYYQSPSSTSNDYYTDGTSTTDYYSDDCTNFGGQCIDSSVNDCAGDLYSGICPGNRDVLCCKERGQRGSDNGNNGNYYQNNQNGNQNQYNNYYYPNQNGNSNYNNPQNNQQSDSNNQNGRDTTHYNYGNTDRRWGTNYNHISHNDPNYYNTPTPTPSPPTPTPTPTPSPPTPNYHNSFASTCADLVGSYCTAPLPPPHSPTANPCTQGGRRIVNAVCPVGVNSDCCVVFNMGGKKSSGGSSQEAVESEMGNEHLMTMEKESGMRRMEKKMKVEVHVDVE